jgi:enoyl-CoA hydratase/carnithine racemase
MENTETYEHILYEVDEEHICWLTFNRPEVLNAFNIRLTREFCNALERADRDENVNAIVIRGAGKGFCAGHDLKEDAEDSFSSIYQYRAHYLRQQVEFTAAWRISTPVIASVHYCAIGKGFELALFSDITIVTDNTRFGYTEMRHGISGMNLVLPYLVHMKDAKMLMLTGRAVTAHEAKTMGLVTEVVPTEQLEERTLKIAKLVARMPRDSQRVHKQFLNRVYELQGLKSATDMYHDLFAILGYCPVDAYQRMSDVTRKKGLRTALAEANARFDDLD